MPSRLEAPPADLALGEQLTLGQRLWCIREYGSWAYWQEGELEGQLKVDWILAIGPEREKASARRSRRNILKNSARLAQLRRDGYWFDAEHRLQAPIASAPTGRVLVASRAPRSRSARRTSSSRGDPDPEPDLPRQVVPPSRFWADVRRWLGGLVSRAEDTQALRDALALVLAASHAFEGGLERFYELTAPYGLNEQQARLGGCSRPWRANPKASKTSTHSLSTWPGGTSERPRASARGGPRTPASTPAACRATRGAGLPTSGTPTSGSRTTGSVAVVPSRLGAQRRCSPFGAGEAGGATVPLISTPEQSTATALRRRVLTLLAAQNGHSKAAK